MGFGGAEGTKAWRKPNLSGTRPADRRALRVAWLQKFCAVRSLDSPGAYFPGSSDRLTLAGSRNSAVHRFTTASGELRLALAGRESLVQRRGHLSATCADLLRQQCGWNRRFSRPDQQARLPARTRDQHDLAFAFLSVASA